MIIEFIKEVILTFWWSIEHFFDPYKPQKTKSLQDIMDINAIDTISNPIQKNSWVNLLLTWKKEKSVGKLY